MNNILEKIKILLIKRDMTMTDLANSLGIKRQSLYSKFNKNNFNERDLEQFAKALNCTVKITFIDNITGEEL